VSVKSSTDRQHGAHVTFGAGYLARVPTMRALGRMSGPEPVPARLATLRARVDCPLSVRLWLPFTACDQVQQVLWLADRAPQGECPAVGFNHVPGGDDAGVAKSSP
jgi:hypothetical protein